MALVLERFLGVKTQIDDIYNSLRHENSFNYDESVTNAVTSASLNASVAQLLADLTRADIDIVKRSWHQVGAPPVRLCDCVRLCVPV